MSDIINKRGSSIADSWVEIIVPDKKRWQLLYGHATYKSGNTAVDPRLFGVRIKDMEGEEIFDIHAGVVQPDDRIVHYELVPGAPRSDVIKASVIVQIPTQFVIFENWVIGLGDIHRRNPYTDELEYSLVFEESKA